MPPLIRPGTGQLQLHWFVPGLISGGMAALFAYLSDRVVPPEVRLRMTQIAIATAITFATLEGAHLAHRSLTALFVLFTGAYGAFAYWAHRTRALAVLAMLAASWIVLSTVWLIKLVPGFDFGADLLAGLWILVSASVSVTALTRWHRLWSAQS